MPEKTRTPAAAVAWPRLRPWQDPAADSSWGEVVYAHNVAAFRALAWTVIGLALALWALDALPSARSAGGTGSVAVGRVMLIAIGAVALAVSRRVDPRSDGMGGAAFATLALEVGIASALLGRFGSPDRPWGALVCLVPLAVVPGLVAPRARLAGALVLGTVGLVGFFGPRGIPSSPEAVVAVAGCVVVASLAAAAWGHLVHHVVRAAHDARCALRDQIAAAHEARLADEAQAARIVEHVGGLGHDLKTPLAVIREGASILASSSSDAPGSEEHEVSRMIVQNSDRLQERIEGLLDYVRRSRTGFSARFEPLALADLVADVVATHAPPMRARGLTLDLALDDVRMTGDAGELRLLIDNLLSNAGKYSMPPGTIRVSVADRDGQVVLEVEDCGVGVAAAERVRIFEPFLRGTASLAHTPDGTGLGLAICRDLVQAHHGRIEVDDVLGGTVFRVILPADASAHRTA